MTSSSDAQRIPAQSSSRRTLLAGALGGLGAAIVSAVGRATPVRAADGDAMVVGGEYTSTSVTRITNTSNAASVIWGESGSGTGVWGTSSSYYGVVGGTYAADRAAVLGKAEPAGNGTGVLGCSGTIPAAKTKTGVYGYANQDAASRGVWGFSGQGAGIYGQANKGGFAVRANGRIKADKVSGVATIAAGSTSVTLSPGVNVVSNSFVLLTPKANIGSRGLWFSTNPAADTITIRMSSARSSDTKIAWLLMG